MDLISFGTARAPLAGARPAFASSPRMRLVEGRAPEARPTSTSASRGKRHYAPGPTGSGRQGELIKAVLTLLVRHQLTGCPRAAGQAACLLDRLTACADLDQETRDLFDRVCERLVHRAQEYF